MIFAIIICSIVWIGMMIWVSVGIKYGKNFNKTREKQLTKECENLKSELEKLKAEMIDLKPELEKIKLENINLRSENIELKLEAANIKYKNVGKDTDNREI
ncbi:MAG: hypothetical protein ACRDCG_02725 [Mycoplasmoidaceae bacterium]